MIHQLLLSFLIISTTIISSAEARTIRWTAAGGNPLWDFGNNWDCLCVPQLDDDVIIDLPNIPGEVTVSTPAYARSLTVGGTSSTLQTLTIQNSVFVAAGGGKILNNGRVILNAAPSTPFASNGVFNASSNLIFLSGSLTGSFYINNVNFSGAAAKQINGTTSVGNIVVDIPVGSQGLINVVGVSGQLVVRNSITATQTMTISTGGNAKFVVNGGNLIYNGGVANTLTILGNADISTLTLNGGKVEINQNVTIGTARVNAGATISLIGAPTSNRVFNDIVGSGTLSIQGGTNTFHAMTDISTVNLAGGVLIADTRQCNIGTFVQTGGVISGKAVVSAGTATLTTAVINNTPLTAGYLNLNGVSSINGGIITVTGLGVVSANSELTLGSGTIFYVTSAARISQNSPLLLVPSGVLPNPPALRNDGKWTSTSDLTIDIQSAGTGSFEFDRGTTLEATGVSFSINSLILSSGQFKSIGSNVTINSVDGTGGTINSQSIAFVVNSNMNVGTYVHQNGLTRIAAGNIGNLNVTSGTFTVFGTGQTSIGNLVFNGGIITSTGVSKIVSVSQTTIVGTELKTLSSVTLSSRAIHLRCGSVQCEILTQSASLTTHRRT